AGKAGLREGDLITKIDGVRVRKISDLTSYIGTKRPGDKVQINYLRDGKEKITKVKLSEYESYVMQLYHGLSFEVTNAEKPYLDKFGADHGVRIARTLSHEMQIPRDQFIIVGIDGQKVNSVSDVRALMKDKGP